MSLCDYCRLERLKQEAQTKNQILTIKKEFASGMLGVHVYQHPKSIKTISEDDPFSRCYLKAWFQTLPKECTCINMQTCE